MRLHPALLPSFRLLTYSRRLSGVLLFLAITATLSAQNLAITTTSPLPPATVGVTYTQTLTAAGASLPVQWAVGTGLPAGLVLDAASGTISGIPTTAGSYSFQVQVTDSRPQNAISTFAMVVNTAPLQILTAAPLFNGQVGLVYSQAFLASGGKTPYTWSIATGETGGLSIDSATGILGGTPQTAGTFNFTVKVVDSANGSASRSYSLTVTPPSLIITAGAPLPAGTVGVAYNQKFSVVVSGGTPPYTWSVLSGSVPGLTFNPSTVELSGTPTAAGTFTITLQAADSAGATASRGFNVTIAPAALGINTERQLPAASLNAPYSQTLTASGGAPPYTWSANGLPTGLTLNSTTGVLSGTPTAAGDFTPVITVTDSALALFRDNFSLSVKLPATPPVTISGLPASVGAAQQFPIQLSIGSAYPAAIRGQLILTFQPSSGPNDSTIQFSTGGRTVNFNIPQGSTSATFLDNAGLSVSQLQLQTGTAAGTIIVTLSNLTAASVDVTPVPAPSVSGQVSAAAPVITNIAVVRNADTATGCKQGQICLQVTGYATSREVTQGTFTFTAASGQSLQTSSITVDVGSVFNTWFAASTVGSQFVLVQSFVVTGDPTAVLPANVTLTNRTGSTTSAVK